jgi:hypothetical protein
MQHGGGTMHEDEEKFIKWLFVVYADLNTLLSQMKLPKGAQEAISFSAANLKHLLAPEESKRWEGTRISNYSSINRVTEEYISFLASVLNAGRALNRARSMVGKNKINMVEEATLYDKRKKASQQSRQAPDPTGQDQETDNPSSQEA